MALMDTPTEDELDVIIGPDDPRFAAEQAAWSAARRKAQALLSAEDLLAGVGDDDWHVRHESLDRLKARWRDDPRTFPPWRGSPRVIRSGTFATTR
jgi:hypothetical protein